MGTMETCEDCVVAKGTKADVSPKGNGGRAKELCGMVVIDFCVVESAIWRANKAGKAAIRYARRQQGPGGFSCAPGIDVDGDRLHGEAARWAVDAFNQSATTANPGNFCPYEVFTERKGPFRMLSFFQRGLMWIRRTHRLGDEATEVFYLNSGDHHPEFCPKVINGSTGRVVYSSKVGGPPGGGNVQMESSTPLASALPTSVEFGPPPLPYPAASTTPPLPQSAAAAACRLYDIAAAAAAYRVFNATAFHCHGATIVADPVRAIDRPAVAATCVGCAATGLSVFRSG
eukprot:g18195.t1